MAQARIGGPIPPDHDPREPIRASYAMTVDGLQPALAFRFFQDNSDVAVTPWTNPCEVSNHQRSALRSRGSSVSDARVPPNINRQPFN